MMAGTVVIPEPPDDVGDGWAPLEGVQMESRQTFGPKRARNGFRVCDVTTPMTRTERTPLYEKS